MPKTSQNPLITEAALPHLGAKRHVSLNIPEGLMGLSHHHRASDGAQWSHLSPHQHDELELKIVSAGHCTLLIKNRKIQLTRGTLIWIFPDQDHLFYNASSDLEKWVTVFRPQFLNKALGDTSLQPLIARDSDTVTSRVISDPALQQLGAICSRLDDHAQDFPIPHYNLGLEWLLHEAWAAYERADEHDQDARIHPAVQRAALQLERYPDTESVPQLAKHAGLSPSRLSRLFRDQMGTSITEFRNARRIDRFFQIYRPQGRYSITEAAFAAGFQSYPQFHRVFARQTGCSPSGFFKQQDGESR